METSNKNPIINKNFKQTKQRAHLLASNITNRKSKKAENKNRKKPKQPSTLQTVLIKPKRSEQKKLHYHFWRITRFSNVLANRNNGINSVLQFNYKTNSETWFKDFNKDLYNQTQINLWLTQQINKQQSGYKKLPLKVYDKVFYYYTLQTPITIYAHKAFVILEMQLNIALVRSKLVPYLFIVQDLCFYRLVYINRIIAKNPYSVLSLYDSLTIPIYLHNYMYYRQYRIQYYPNSVSQFFKKYWIHFTNYTSNKLWILSTFVTSDITAEAITFEYPNILLYMGPFKRFTKLYYRNQPYAPSGRHRYLNHTHSVLKLKLFEYAAFYK